MALPRLRQVALVAATLAVADRLRSELDLGEPFADPGVGEFGLVNAVFAVGGDFLEVVAPAAQGTAAGRYLARRGGDGGYMALFQVGDMAAARRRLDAIGIRTVWQADLPAMSGTHLHPRDVGGAIVSLDEARPPDSWQWGGPDWTGAAPPHPPGGIVRLTVETPEPHVLAERWAAALGVSADDDGACIPLDGGRQQVSFVASGGRERIVRVEAVASGPTRTCAIGSATIEIAGSDS